MSTYRTDTSLPSEYRSVWNPGEACSQACLEIARPVCKELGIELVEAAVDNSTAVYEAALSLLTRGVEAIWIGGDNTVELASSSVITAASRGRIPVFTNNTDHPAEGALLGLGANYFEVGKRAGDLAAEVLNGLSPASVPIEDVTPPKLILNADALKNLKDNWVFPESVLKSADSVIGAGVISKKEIKPPVKKMNIVLKQYNDSTGSEEPLKGVCFLI